MSIINYAKCDKSKAIHNLLNFAFFMENNTRFIIIIDCFFSRQTMWRTTKKTLKYYTLKKFNGCECHFNENVTVVKHHP